MVLETNYQIVTVPRNAAEKLKKQYACYKNGVCKVMPGNLINSLALKETVLPQIHSTEFRSSDVFVCSFPRSGSTWTQEIAWAMTHNPNLDHDQSEGHSYEKALHLELDATYGVYGLPKIFQSLLEEHQASNFLDLIDMVDSPRVLKTHLFIDLLPKSAQEKSKFIYVIRNPLSSCMSFFHLSKDMKFLSFTGDLDEFVDCFIEGKANDTVATELTDEQKSKLKKYFRENLEDVELPYDFSD